MNINFDDILGKIDNIKKDVDKQGDALITASQAMEDTFNKLTEAIHFIRKMESGPITQNERQLLQYLYQASTILSEASINVKFLTNQQ